MIIDLIVTVSLLWVQCLGYYSAHDTDTSCTKNHFHEHVLFKSKKEPHLFFLSPLLIQTVRCLFLQVCFMEISFLRYLLYASGELRKLLLPSLRFHLDLETSCYLLSMAQPINTAQNWLNNDRGICGIVSKHTFLVSLCSVMSPVGRLGVTILPRSSGIWYYPLSGLTESQIKSNLV